MTRSTRWSRSRTPRCSSSAASRRWRRLTPPQMTRAGPAVSIGRSGFAMEWTTIKGRASLASGVAILIMPMALGIDDDPRHVHQRRHERRRRRRRIEAEALGDERQDRADEGAEGHEAYANVERNSRQGQRQRGEKTMPITARISSSSRPVMSAMTRRAIVSASIKGRERPVAAGAARPQPHGAIAACASRCGDDHVAERGRRSLTIPESLTLRARGIAT